MKPGISHATKNGVLFYSRYMNARRVTKATGLAVYLLLLNIEETEKNNTGRGSSIPINISGNEIHDPLAV